MYQIFDDQKETCIITEDIHFKLMDKFLTLKRETCLLPKIFTLNEQTNSWLWKRKHALLLKIQNLPRTNGQTQHYEKGNMYYY